MKATLVRGSFEQENEEAKKALENSDIAFSQIFSSSNYSPILILADETFPYKGVSSIKDYCESIKNSNPL